MAQQRYMPFGDVRELSGSARISETDYGYTGQRALSGVRSLSADEVVKKENLTGLKDLSGFFLRPVGAFC